MYHDVALTGRVGWCEDVSSFTFERPEEYRFEPGQHFSLELSTIEGRRSKPFSHAAAPGDPHIELATHLSGSVFKRALDSLRPGDRVRISSAAGRLVLPPDAGRVVFLVGGIGITPVRSMLRDSVQRTSELEAALLYGNRSADCVLYREELDAYGKNGIEVVHVLEHPADDWSGEMGFITPTLVRHHSDLGRDLFVTAGPPGMVAAMEACMNELGVPEKNRLVERFAGYA